MARKIVGHVHLEWVCPSCGVKNLGVERICKGCGQPQPDDVAFELSQQERLLSEEELSSLPSQGPDIHCPYCGARNRADAKYCTQCAGDLTQGASRQAGAVIGSFQQDRTLSQIICQNCKTANPETSATCSTCGAPLMKVMPAAPAKQPAKKINPIVLILLVLFGVGLCVLFGIFLFNSFKTTSTQGTVNAVYWERSVELEQYAIVKKEDWENEIPGSARILGCTQKYHHTQDTPAQNSEEVCGTPYVVDKGTGVGEKVVDCQYRVFMDYCTYEAMDWIVFDTVKTSGTDLSAYWPDPALGSQERLGKQQEAYVCQFSTSEGILEYRTSSLDDFSQCQIGSEWNLTVSSAGRVIEFSR